MSNITIADEGDKVVLVIDGQRVGEMPPEIAHQVSKAIYAKACVADEFRNANRIIMDQAILQRSGALFGLSNNRKIVEEARKEAQWNTDLRRAMPLRGIEPKGVVGTPSLRKVAKGT